MVARFACPSWQRENETLASKIRKHEAPSKDASCGGMNQQSAVNGRCVYLIIVIRVRKKKAIHREIFIKKSSRAMLYRIRPSLLAEEIPTASSRPTENNRKNSLAYKIIMCVALPGVACRFEHASHANYSIDGAPSTTGLHTLRWRSHS